MGCGAWRNPVKLFYYLQSVLKLQLVEPLFSLDGFQYMLIMTHHVIPFF